MNVNQDPKWIKDIPINMVIELGRSKKSVDEILQWRKGATIKLDESEMNILKIFINNRYFGYGDILRNEDGEMSLRMKKIEMDERSLRDVSKNTDL